MSAHASDLHAAAVVWAHRGIPVFPCRVAGKEPATKQGVKDATRELAQIDVWWTANPHANVGGAVGALARCWVLDLDGEEGIAALAALEAEYGQLPITFTVATGGGGRHLFWLLPEGVEVRNSASKVAPHVDVRGTGGYVVLPPSLHPSGGEYAILHDVPRALAPQWLLDRVVAPKPKAPTPAAQHALDSLLREPAGGGTDAQRLAGIVRAAADRIRSAPQGTRNETLNEACFSVGGWIDGLGGTVDQVAGELEAAAVAAEQPVATVRRALEQGRERPRGRPPDVAPATPPAPTWLARLQAGIEAGAMDELLRDPEVASGVVRPGALAGEVEVLLKRLPPADQQRLRRTGKSLVAAAKTAQRASAPPLAQLPLVVEHGGAWRVLDRDSYLQVDRINVATEVARLHKIDTTIPTESGSRYMTPAEVYGSYGQTAKVIRWSYDAEGGPAWDPETRALDIPGAKVRQGRAERVPEVEAWLACFVATGQLPTLLDWLATAHLLDRPTSSPQFRGPDSAGKALLVAGLTTWLGGATDYAHATSEFNGSLVYGPLVVLDEGVAESNPDAFRRLTGNREHAVCAKNRMPEVLRGCPRVVVTSNESDPLRLGREELSSQSEHALGKRILVFDVQQSAADYLAELGGWAATSGWAAPDGDVVAHLRWLAATRDVAVGDRFLVAGDAAGWVASAHLRVGLAGDVVQAYTAYLDLVDEGQTSEVSDPQPFWFDGGRPGVVGLSCRGLQAHWQRLVGDAKVPSHQRLSAVLRQLSGQEQATRPGGRDRGPRVYLVSASKLSGGDG